MSLIQNVLTFSISFLICEKISPWNKNVDADCIECPVSSESSKGCGKDYLLVVVPL